MSFGTVAILQSLRVCGSAVLDGWGSVERTDLWFLDTESIIGPHLKKQKQKTCAFSLASAYPCPDGCNVLLSTQTTQCSELMRKGLAVFIREPQPSVQHGYCVFHFHHIGGRFKLSSQSLDLSPSCKSGSVFLLNSRLAAEPERNGDEDERTREEEQKLTTTTSTTTRVVCTKMSWHSMGQHDDH